MRIMRFPRRSRSGNLVFSWHSIPVLFSLFLALTLAACSSTATTTTGGGGTTNGHTSATATTSGSSGGPTATPGPAPSHAFAWYQIDSAQVPQIWAALNGGSPQQITHVAADHAACDDQVAWGLPVFSPDLTHIVSSLGSYQCGDGDLSGQVSIVTVSNGTISPVGSAGANTSVSLTERVAGWLDNNSIWYINYTGLYTYSLGASSPTLIATLNQPFDAVLRGATLYWTHINSTSGGGGAVALHSFNINTHVDLGTSVSLGTTTSCKCSLGGIMVPGWDVSPDGAHIAYQVVSPSSSGQLDEVGASHFYYANPDGSNATSIADYVSTNHLVRLLFSPNGQLIAISTATPSPSVISAGVNSPGHNGDPNLHFYSPDGVSFPVWKWDNSEFWAAHAEPGNSGNGVSPALYRYVVGAASGVLSTSGGLNPWYTIGG